MTARLRIDLGALVANYARLKEAARPGTSAAVVKADAYGLGAEPVARALWEAGCRDFFVATAGEGTALRAALPEAAIYVFEGACSESVAELLAARLIPVLNHHGQLELWRRAAGGRPAAVHVDTGMNRLGFPAELSAGAFSGVNVPVRRCSGMATSVSPIAPRTTVGTPSSSSMPMPTSSPVCRRAYHVE